MQTESMLVIGNQAKNPITGKSEKVISINGLRVDLETETFDAEQIFAAEKDTVAIRAITSK